MIKLILFFSLIVNLFLFILINKKKIKNFFYRKNIKTISIEFIHPIFKHKIINSETKFPMDSHVSKMILVHDKDYNVKGLITDYETWILSLMSKIRTKKNSPSVLTTFKLSKNLSFAEKILLPFKTHLPD